MREVRVEHNLSDFELEEALEKALAAARKNRPLVRKFREPALNIMSERVLSCFDNQMKRMMKRVEAVIQG